MKKDKVLLVMHYPPPVHGAAMVGRYIKESAVINSAFEGRYINLSTSRTVDEIGATGIQKWIRYLEILKSLVINLIKFRPKLVYFTLTAVGIGFYKDAILILISKLFGKNILIHFHNKGVRTQQDRFFDNLLYKLVFKGTKVILLAPQLYADVQKYVSLENVHYCSNGVPEIKLKAESNTKNIKVQLLFLSNLIASKGVLILLEACRILKDNGLDFRCNYVGGAGDLSVLEFEQEIKKRNLSDKVCYLGKKYGNEKNKIYAQADIFILPTYYANECFPLVLLEAMQFSLPLVATGEGGIPDIVDDGINGFLILPRDAHSLSQKLEALIADAELRSKMGKRAYHKFKEKYTLELFEQRFLSILKKEVQ